MWLVELASEVGVYYEEPKSVTFSDWGAMVFSNEQVKYAIHDAYASYLIANNLEFALGHLVKMVFKSFVWSSYFMGFIYVFFFKKTIVILSDL